jgi:putative DNA primase/helicase
VSNLAEFAAAIRVFGLMPKRGVISDGKWHRCPTEDRPKKMNGKYKFDGEVGAFINFRTMSDSVFWHSNKPLSAEDKAKYARDMAAQRAREAQTQAQAIERVRAYFARLPMLSELHPYLSGKGLTGAGCFGVRADGDLMVIPSYRKGDLMTVQTIAPDGSKRFRKDCPKQGSYFVIERKGATVTAFVEGFATGLAVFQSVPNCRVVVCFDAGNLVAVARDFKPRGLTLVCADNDYAAPSNKGVECGFEAAGLMRCGVTYPQDILGSDFDDALREWGSSGVSRVRDLVMRNAVMVF